MRSIFASISLLACTVAWLLISAQGIAEAQEAMPGTPEMVEALRPRTRSLRNLVVGEVAASAPAASAPSASSQGAAPAPVLAEAAAPRPSLSMAVRFDFDSARLRPEAEVLLDRLAAALQATELKDSRFLIEGHTDAQGSANYNLHLSQLRADEVRRYLMAQGVAGARLTAQGRGAQEPVNPASPHAAENRRVRIINTE